MKTKYKRGGFYWEREVYQSDAFLALGKNGKMIVIAALDNRQRESKNRAKGKRGNKRKPKFINLDRLVLPYGLFEKTYKIPRGRIPAAIDEVLAKGFLKIVYHGGRSKHDKTIYAWSNSFLLWTPGATPLEVRPKREKHGYQGKAIGARRAKNNVLDIRKKQS